MVLKERWRLGCLRELCMSSMRTPRQKKKKKKTKEDLAEAVEAKMDADGTAD